MKTQIQKLKSSKLFYNKWPYKVLCHVNGGNRVIRNGVDLVEAWCETGKGLAFARHEGQNINKQDLLCFALAVKPFLKRKDLQIRVEGRHFNLFCKDYSVLEQIDNALNKWIKQILGPTSQEEYDFMMSNGHKKILCDKLPKGTYGYKIYFKNKFPEHNRLGFIKWLEPYNDKINVVGTTRLWLEGRKRYIEAPFMYVKDDKMLSMVGLYLSGYVKKTEEFILRENALTA